MIRYVLGFVFDDSGDHVVLIQKTKPAWQAGKWNGLGGKIEPWESAHKAMIREFEEEAGVYSADWVNFGRMVGPDWDCELFYVFNTNVRALVTTRTDEKVCTFSVQSLPETISNVPWLIAAARNHKQNRGEFTLEVKYA